VAPCSGRVTEPRSCEYGRGPVGTLFRYRDYRCAGDLLVLLYWAIHRPDALVSIYQPLLASEAGLVSGPPRSRGRAALGA
jgi:hypothetical protein